MVGVGNGRVNPALKQRVGCSCIVEKEMVKVHLEMAKLHIPQSCLEMSIIEYIFLYETNHDLDSSIQNLASHVGLLW